MHNLVIFQCFSEQVYYKKKFGSVLVNFQFRAEVKKVTSQAELKNLQLELWLEPARLTTVHTEVHFASFLSGGFITAIVVNPPERKLTKRTSVQ